MATDRRKFIKNIAITGVGISLVPLSACSSKSADVDQKIFPFEQAPLGYSYAALAPKIDAETMEIHYSKHHAGYVKKLNAALEEHMLKGKPLDYILESVSNNSKDEKILNNAGGHFNHTLFWDILTPGGSVNPSGSLSEAIDRDIPEFGNELKKAALSVFGSGWAWVILKTDGKLEITTTQNQENPLMKNIVGSVGTPIIGLDVWEHAYYLNYQNKRGDYLDNLISVLNWDVITKRYQSALDSLK